jgi:hypothetical protein
MLRSKAILSLRLLDQRNQRSECRQNLNRLRRFLVIDRHRRLSLSLQFLGRLQLLMGFHLNFLRHHRLRWLHRPYLHRRLRV